MEIRERRPGDDAEWLRLRCLLWPDGSVDAHRQGMEAWLARPQTTVLVAAREDGSGLAGFAEVGTRPFADGCDSSPVAYLEGWYVAPADRRRGVGRALLLAAEEWARAGGFSEIASDVALGNLPSQRAHEALGFVEVVRAVLYRKPLPAAAGVAPVAAAGEPGPPTWNVRILGPGDAGTARALVSAFHESDLQDAYFEALLGDPANLLAVAGTDGGTIGFVWAHWLSRLRREQRQLFVYEIEVAPAHRRRGVGTSLMRAVLAQARARKADVFVMTNRSNRAAVAFFERLGGQPKGGDDLLFAYPHGESA